MQRIALSQIFERKPLCTMNKLSRHTITYCNYSAQYVTYNATKSRVPVWKNFQKNSKLFNLAIVTTCFPHVEIYLAYIGSQSKCEILLIAFF